MRLTLCLVISNRLDKIQDHSRHPEPAKQAEECSLPRRPEDFLPHEGLALFHADTSWKLKDAHKGHSHAFGYTSEGTGM